MSGLRRYLELIASGETVYRAAVLRRLSADSVFVPVTEEGSVDGNELIVSVVTIVAGERRCFVAFTDEELLRDWAKGRCEPLALKGDDFATAIPKDCWLLLNPELPEALELTPRDVERILDLARGRVFEQASGEEQTKPMQGILGELAQLLQSYREVIEAYYLPPTENYPGGLLGLVTTGLHQDMRLLIVSEVGRISRSYFGSAGALELLDEEIEKRAPQWSLLGDIPPFYSQAKAERAVQGARPGRPRRSVPFEPFRIDRDDKEHR